MRMSGPTGHPFRRTGMVALVAMLATGATLLGPGFAGAEEEFVNGSGRARASIVRVGPSASQLSLAPTVGLALTDFIGSLGRSETFIFDYAALDNTINDSFPDLKIEFPPLRVESRDEGSAAGVRWEPKPGLVETGQATAAPVGRGSVAIEGFNIPGVIEVTGGKARSFSGIYFRTGDDGKRHLIRAAGGTVDIPRVALGGNRVILQHLRWEGAHITDENDDDTPEALGGFTVGRMIVDGEVQGEGMTHEELGQVFGPLNEQLLSQLGLSIEAPRFFPQGAAVFVTPLRIGLASGALGPVGEGIQQVRGEPSEAFIEECQAAESGEAESSNGGGGGAGVPLGRPDPGPEAHGQASGGGPEEFDEFDNNGPDGAKQDADFTPPGGSGSSDCGVPFLVADLALAPVTGFGRLEIDLGGVSGTTEGSIFDGFNLFGGGIESPGGTFEPPAASASSGGGASVLSGGTTNPTPPSTGTTSAPPPTQGGTTEVAAPQVFKLTGSRASAAWAVGLVGLGAALAMASSDYRRLRMRRRAVTPIT